MLTKANEKKETFETILVRVKDKQYALDWMTFNRYWIGDGCKNKSRNSIAL